MHCNEVISDNEQEKEEIGSRSEQEEAEEAKPKYHHVGGVSGGTFNTLTSTTKYNLFRVTGVLQGQRVTVLIDSGASHNFIGKDLVAKRGIEVEDFKGFSMPCAEKISSLSNKLGNHQVTTCFYVVGIEEIDVILGAQ